MSCESTVMHVLKFGSSQWCQKSSPIMLTDPSPMKAESYEVKQNEQSAAACVRHRACQFHAPMQGLDCSISAESES